MCKINYTQIHEYDVAEKWKNLEWQKVNREAGKAVLPPDAPGLYRPVLKIFAVSTMHPLTNWYLSLIDIIWSNNQVLQ